MSLIELIFRKAGEVFKFTKDRLRLLQFGKSLQNIFLVHLQLVAPMILWRHVLFLLDTRPQRPQRYDHKPPTTEIWSDEFNGDLFFFSYRKTNYCGVLVCFYGNMNYYVQKKLRVISNSMQESAKNVKILNAPSRDHFPLFCFFLNLAISLEVVVFRNLTIL